MLGEMYKNHNARSSEEESCNVAFWNIQRWTDRLIQNVFRLAFFSNFAYDNWRFLFIDIFDLVFFVNLRHSYADQYRG